MNLLMNSHFFPTSRFAAISAVLALSICRSGAADPAPALSASELAARLSASRQDGSSYVRLRLEATQQAGAPKNVLQLQIKQRATKSGTDIVYQVLWPKERKGESVLLRKSGNRPASGTAFTPPDGIRNLDASQMKEPLFGSDLCYEDIVEDFFSWDQQALKGTEAIDRVNCQILESKPGKGERSTYGSVRTWVDPRRFVPLRIEKYSPSGQLMRRIETTRIVSDDKGRAIPANLTVRGSREGSVTELDGSKIKHDVAYTDRDFSAEGIREITTPRASAD
jgi:hypothetical protein